ncbi:transposase [Xanthomonas oryzae]|nr:transposase [Xanthomonas oryzae pv. oryzae]KOR47445.1 transposase [Xanthomonas oryzae]
MKKRFSEEQIIGFLREAEAGMAIKDLCRRHGFSEASYYLWRSKFGGMSVPDAKRLKDLEAENTRLKRALRPGGDRHERQCAALSPARGPQR